MGKLAEEVQTKEGFASFPADIAILYEDLAFVEAISSSKDAREKVLQLREKFMQEDKNINTEASVSKNAKTGRPVSVELCSNVTTCGETINWLVFSDTFGGFQCVTLYKDQSRRTHPSIKLSCRFRISIAHVLPIHRGRASNNDCYGINFITKRILRRFSHPSKATNKTDSNDPTHSRTCAIDMPISEPKLALVFTEAALLCFH